MNDTLKTIGQWIVLPAMVGVGVYFLSRHDVEDCTNKIKANVTSQALVEEYKSNPQALKRFDGLADYIKEQEVKALQAIYSEVPVPAGLARPEEPFNV